MGSFLNDFMVGDFLLKSYEIRRVKLRKSWMLSSLYLNARRCKINGLFGSNSHFMPLIVSMSAYMAI